MDPIEMTRKELERLGPPIKMTLEYLSDKEIEDLPVLKARPVVIVDRDDPRETA